MHLSEPIVIKRSTWAILDIGAFLMVVGGILAIFAIGSGAWQPMGDVLFPYWHGLFFLIWMGTLTAAIFLVGFQLALSPSHTLEAASEEAPRAIAVTSDAPRLASEPGQREPATAAPA